MFGDNGQIDRALGVGLYGGKALFGALLMKVNAVGKAVAPGLPSQLWITLNRSIDLTTALLDEAADFVNQLAIFCVGAAMEGDGNRSSCPHLLRGGFAG